jgi:hypothetical protein
MREDMRKKQIDDANKRISDTETKYQLMRTMERINHDRDPNDSPPKRTTPQFKKGRKSSKKKANTKKATKYVQSPKGTQGVIFGAGGGPK